MDWWGPEMVLWRLSKFSRKGSDPCHWPRIAMGIRGNRGCGWNRCEHRAGLCIGGNRSAAVAGMERKCSEIKKYCGATREGSGAFKSDCDWSDQESAASAMADRGIF